jgi:putative SOS response-associated peptidase YedK
VRRSRSRTWIAADADAAIAMLLASELPPMVAYRVSRAVNTPRNNRADLLATAG